MKKYIIFLFLALLSFCSYAASNVVNVYIWSNYLPPSVIKQFQQETGIHINYSTFDSNETLYAKLKAAPNAGYDIIVPSTYFVERMRRQGMIQRLDKSKLPNFKHLNPDFLSKPFDPNNEYSLPYFWLATGIVYNDKYYQQNTIKHWSDFWKPELENELLMLDDMRDVFSVALISLGYSPNETNPAHIKAAYLKLKALMRNIKVFNGEAATSIYIDEDVLLGMGWSGDTYLAFRENPHIKFIYPEEGYVIAMDSMAIASGAKHVENAYIFMNFIMRPDIAKKISLETGFASPNLSAVKMMSPEELNPITYPDKKTLERGIFQTDLGDTVSIYEKYWEKLKIGGVP